MKVSVKSKDKIISIETKSSGILTTLAQHSLFVSAYCSGRGLCGKCKIRYLSSPPIPAEKEESILSDGELKNGFRLACLHKFKENDYIEIFETKPVFSEDSGVVCAEDNGSYIAVDIGTTTISASLIEDKKQIKTIRMLNPQVVFGGDVMTRIAKREKNSQQVLTLILNKAVKDTTEKLISASREKKTKEIIVCANPTMLSYFLGIDTKPIGEYPYTPPFKGAKKTKWNGFDIYIPPVISAFIGSDITTGLINLDISDNFLFIDIGTNCEFVLKRNDNFYAASIPGGPALEGVGIDFGMTAQEGAIDKVEFDKTLKCRTIGNKKPEGITGSGLISAIAFLNRFEIIDRSGRIKEAWEMEDIPFNLLSRIKKDGFLLENGIYITQNSIREFQLVKGALNAGIDILLQKTGSNINNIEKIYISGGFTKSLTKQDIIYSNLLNIDKEFVFLGNSALKGALKLFCKKNRVYLEEVAKKIEYIEIANQSNFQELYIKYMDFI